MKIEIEHAKNGWLIRAVYSESEQEDAQESDYWVFNHNDDEKSEAEAFASLLWHVKELMGPQDSRYSKHRVMVDIQPGDKSNDGLG